MLAMYSRYQILVNELCATVRDIADEAQRGDADAKQWLLCCFPGHEHFLQQSWYPPPTPAIIAKLRRFALTPESLALVDRIASKGHQTRDHTKR